MSKKHHQKQSTTMKQTSRLSLLWEFVYLSRVLYPRVVVKSPSKILIETATHKKAEQLEALAQELAESIAKLNQITRLRKGVTIIYSTKEDHLNALSLIKEQINPSTMIYRGALEAHRAIQKYYSNQSFTARELMERTGYSKSETNRHLKRLQYYNLIEQRTGGYRNRGYLYQLQR
jgi:DNA-binding MarR family transcriptional regulator